jgi:hypothetical protein
MSIMQTNQTAYGGCVGYVGIYVGISKFAPACILVSVHSDLSLRQWACPLQVNPTLPISIVID